MAVGRRGWDRRTSCARRSQRADRSRPCSDATLDWPGCVSADDVSGTYGIVGYSPPVVADHEGVVDYAPVRKWCRRGLVCRWRVPGDVDRADVRTKRGHAASRREWQPRPAARRRQDRVAQRKAVHPAESWRGVARIGRYRCADTNLLLVCERGNADQRPRRRRALGARSEQPGHIPFHDLDGRGRNQGP